MGRDGFQGLKVWQKSKDLAVQVYKLTEQGMFRKDYGLRDQVRRSSVSIPSNIAEGAGRGSDADFSRFLIIARGSLCELETQYLLSKQLGFIPDSADMLLEIQQLMQMLAGLIRHLKNRDS